MRAFSGGQFQRVLLARALLMSPDILILDEATQGLDQPGAADFYRKIAHVRSHLNCALLIIPPAAARPLARTPETMALITAAIGSFAAISGLGASFRFDTPTGPTIVCVAAALFCITAIVARIKAS